MSLRLVIAYTLGNPEAYDPALARGPLKKAIGGVAYATQAEAEAVVEAEPAGFLPPEWFEGRLLPGAVYEIQLPGEFRLFTSPGPGYRKLAVQAPILGKPMATVWDRTVEALANPRPDPLIPGPDAVLASTRAWLAGFKASGGIFPGSLNCHGRAALEGATPIEQLADPRRR